MSNNIITQSRLHELFDYREDGHLIWKVRKSTKTKIGDIAGSITSHNYRSVRINSKAYKVHRMIFLYHHGYLTPNMEIDHIDGDRTNNRIENLREVTSRQNKQNTKLKSVNTSGIKGVFWYERTKKWMVLIRAGGKQVFLGYFNTKEEAEIVVKKAREKYHGEYAKHD